ncbi:hypothetical protein TorRG33x02_149290, partial [Trema orientale]
MSSSHQLPTKSRLCLLPLIVPPNRLGTRMKPQLFAAKFGNFIDIHRRSTLLAVRSPPLECKTIGPSHRFHLNHSR